MTETLANTTLTLLAGAVQIGVYRQPSGPTDAFVTFTNNYCPNAAYGDSGGDNPIPQETCSTSEQSVFASTLGSSVDAPGDPTDFGNQVVSAGFQDISLTSAGIYDSAFLSGGSTDGPTPGQYQAALANFENDFIETTADVSAPEPGTCLLLGGALLGLGIIRRKKNA